VYSFLLVFYSNFVRKMHRFWDIRLVTIPWPWNPGYGSLKSSEPTRIDSPPMISYLRSIVTMGLSRTVSEIYGDFSRKSQNFPTNLLFCVPAEGVPFGIGYRRWGQKN